MTDPTIAWVEFAIDLFGLVFCLTVLAYGVRYRKTPVAPRTDAFNAEMRLQMVQQQAEATLAALNAAMADMPSHGLSGRSPAPDAINGDPSAPNPALQGQTLPVPTLPARRPHSGFPYEAIRELADQGLEVDAIYHRLHIPKGEIRLALHLRGAGGSRLMALG